MEHASGRYREAGCAGPDHIHSAQENSRLVRVLTTPIFPKNLVWSGESFLDFWPKFGIARIHRCVDTSFLFRRFSYSFVLINRVPRTVNRPNAARIERDSAREALALGLAKFHIEVLSMSGWRSGRFSAFCHWLAQESWRWRAFGAHTTLCLDFAAVKKLAGTK